MITKRITIHKEGALKVTTFVCLNKGEKPLRISSFNRASTYEKVIKLIFKMNLTSSAEMTRIINEYIEKNYIKSKEKEKDNVV